MAVEQVDEDFRCNICGNEVRLTRVGVGILVCCTTHATFRPTTIYWIHFTRLWLHTVARAPEFFQAFF